MQFHRLAAAAALALALAACGDKGKEATGATDDDGAPAAGATTTDTPAAPPAKVEDVAPAPVGEAAGADDTTISASDEKLATGQFYDAYPLDMESGHGVELTVTANGFKPVLLLLDPNQQPMSETSPVTQNADGSWTLSFSETFPQGGQYFVIIAAEQVGATGSYSVEARRSRPIG